MAAAPKTVARALTLAERAFSRRKLDSPALSAQLLLAEVLNCPRIDLLLQRSRPLSPDAWRSFWRLAARRAAGEPVACILGRKEFYGREFGVNNAVLIPRPETEHLVETVLQRLQPSRPAVFADLGTGSGILAVTLALELPRSLGLALDICPRALETARSNARQLHVSDRVLFLRADFVHCPLLPESLDLLVSNPPYVSAAEHQLLSPEVTRFEPRHALVPLQGEGRSGLESIAHVLAAGARVLKPDGLLVMELGAGQGQAALELAAGGAWSQTEVLPDLAGRDRVLAARL